MKRIIQLTLFLFLLLISAIFYQIYFGEEKEVISESVKNDEKISIQGENNLIENLKYEVRLKQGHQYIITSDLSEISYQENQEIVKMYKVIAIFIDDTNIPITITSDEAIYNNSNYNTNFSKNIKIKYLDNIISSDKIDLNFQDNLITIYENVIYDGLKGSIIADNIKINLITKKIQIYMEGSDNKVKISTK